MSIFNENYDIKMNEVYELSNLYAHTFVALSDSFVNSDDWKIRKHFPNCSELYDLCSARFGSYPFFHGMNTHDFINYAVQAFGECTFGGISNMNQQLQKCCKIPDIKIDIIHDFRKALDEFQPLTVPDDENLKTKRIAISFPSYNEHQYPWNFDKTWVMMYVYKNDAPKKFWCACFPLIPKQGYIDVFNAR